VLTRHIADHINADRSAEVFISYHVLFVPRKVGNVQNIDIGARSYTQFISIWQDSHNIHTIKSEKPRLTFVATN